VHHHSAHGRTRICQEDLNDVVTSFLQVIPVVLRHGDWHSAPIGKLMVPPRETANLSLHGQTGMTPSITMF
jgi:hypothetical protein